MKLLWECIKVTGQFIAWSFMTLIFKPFKWVGVTAVKAYKASKTPKFASADVASDVQMEAAKKLPELTKKLDELNKEMKKLSDKHAVLDVEKKLITSLIAAAGGDFGQHAKPKGKNNSNNGNNGNNKQKNKQNGGNGNTTPALGDADFA